MRQDAYLRKRSQEVVDILAAVFLGVLVSLSFERVPIGDGGIDVVFSGGLFFWVLLANYLIDWISLSLVLRDGLAPTYFVGALILVFVEGYMCVLALDHEPVVAVVVAALTAVAAFVYDFRQHGLEAKFWAVIRLLLVFSVGLMVLLPLLVDASAMDTSAMTVVMAVYATIKVVRLVAKWPQEQIAGTMEGI